MQIEVRDAQARMEDLVERVEAGEEVILTESGTSVAKLVPPT